MTSDSGPFFFAAPSKAFLCPLGPHVIASPHISISCGHTFCKACVLQSEEKAKQTGAALTCPADGLALSSSSLIPNIALSLQLSELPVACKHGIQAGTPSDSSVARVFNATGDVVGVHDPKGCPEHLKVGASLACELLD